MSRRLPQSFPPQQALSDGEGAAQVAQRNMCASSLEDTRTNTHTHSVHARVCGDVHDDAYLVQDAWHCNERRTGNWVREV